MVVDGPDGQREVSSDDFFTGFLETAVGEQDLLTEIRVPKVPDAGWSFQKFNRRAQDWAIVGAAVLVNGGSCGVGLVNMDSRPVRAAGVESAIAGGADAADAAASAADGLEPPADLNAGVEYRQHLARVLTRRGLEEAGA
jgi:carbon-monoxide dehydrogenase medium subunit